MYNGFSIDTIGKFSAIIVPFVLGALVYGSNQLISIVTTKPLDRQLKDTFNQAKLKLWFYTISIVFGVIVYLIYAIIFTKVYMIIINIVSFVECWHLVYSIAIF